MVQFTTYEEENIHYWTNRAPGYSAVNQEELAGDQKTVWRGVISGRIAAHLPENDRRRSEFSMSAPDRAFLPSFWRSLAIR